MYLGRGKMTATLQTFLLLIFLYENCCIYQNSSEEILCQWSNKPSAIVSAEHTNIPYLNKSWPILLPHTVRCGYNGSIFYRILTKYMPKLAP